MTLKYKYGIIQDYRGSIGASALVRPVINNKQNKPRRD